MSTDPFPPTSRYAGLEIARIDLPDGRTVVYVRRRFVPQPERFATLTEHAVTEGERPDTIAADAFGDPERFWLLCDANRALRPQDLTAEIGRRLRLTMPEGLPGVPGA
jgi:hypothetical protein